MNRAAELERYYSQSYPPAVINPLRAEAAKTVRRSSPAVDPGVYTVAEVTAWAADAATADVQAAHDAEADGKARTTLLGALADELATREDV